MGPLQADPSFWQSTSFFLKGVLRRWYFWAFAILLDPFEIHNRFLKHSLPFEWQRDIELPSQLGLLLLIVLLLWAGACTYHELRVQAKRRTDDLSKPDSRIELGRACLRRILEDVPRIRAIHERGQANIDSLYQWYSKATIPVVAKVCGRVAAEELEAAWKGQLGAARSDARAEFIWRAEQIEPFIEICGEWITARANSLNKDSINPLYYYEQ